MKFKEYMENRGNNGISIFECKVFGIEKSKGWKERYADLEITQSQINKIVTFMDKKITASPKVKGNIRSLQKREYVEWEGKYLYLMKNEIGRLKIGISEDPIKRSRDITNAGGILTQCIAYWKVSKLTKDVESFLLKKWYEHKTYGEWFVSNAFSIKDIESSMPCDFERLFYNEEWDCSVFY